MLFGFNNGLTFKLPLQTKDDVLILERHIMKNIPGGHNLFVPDQVGIQTTVHSIHNRVHNTPYSVLNTGYILYIVHNREYLVQYTVHKTKYSVRGTSYAMQITKCTIHNTVYIMLTQYREQANKNTVFNSGHCTQYRVCPINCSK